MNTNHNASQEEETITTTDDQVDVYSDVDTDETTLGDVLDDAEDGGSQTTQDKKGTKREESVPLHVVIDMKEEIKTLKRQLKDKEITTEEFNDSAKDLLEEYSDVDPGFVKKLLAAAREDARKELLPEIDKINHSKKVEQQQATLKKLLDNSVAANPEFADVVNEDVILQLAKNPANKGKTMTQLIEETYGKTLQGGTKTMENSRGGKGGNEKPNFNNMTSEEEREVLADPVLRKEYAKEQSKLIQNLL